jgi:hypothetical protein
MNSLVAHEKYLRQRRSVAAAVLSGVLVFNAPDAQAAGRHDIELPARSEFGLGPRVAVGGHYTAVLQPSQAGALPDLADVPRVAGPVTDVDARRAWNGLSERQRDSVTGVFVNIGKAIAAFERTIEPGPSRFDRYVDALFATGEQWSSAHKQ